MPYCYAPGCKHSSRNSRCSLFRFPSANTKEYKKWVQNTRRTDRMPNTNDRLCSCHFVENDKKNTPSIFEYNVVTDCLEIVYNEPEKRIRGTKPSEIPPDEQPVSLEESDIKPDPYEIPDVKPVVPFYDPIPGPSHTLQAPSTASLLSNVPPQGPNLSPVSQVKPISNVTPQGSNLSPVPKPSFSALNEAELYFLRQENQKLKEKLDKIGDALSYESVKKSNLKLFQYTGLPSSGHFEILLKRIKQLEIKYYSGWTVTQISQEDQLLCTLVKLRLNLELFDLSYRFKVSLPTVQNIFVTYLSVLHELLFVGCMDIVPSAEKNHIPSCFTPFPNIKMVVECTNVDVAMPPLLLGQKAAYSTYKHTQTYKVLLGIAPSAAITFVSDLYPEAFSDKDIAVKSGILSHTVAGDLILCDKAFHIGDLCEPLGVHVNLPVTLKSNPQSTREEVAKVSQRSNPQSAKEELVKISQITKARIHVEKAIVRLKSFRILDHILIDVREHSNKIVQTCAALVNMQYCGLKESEQVKEK
ncbi:hypothetical protein WDU94_000064 [Cyamophila willieti]